MEGLDADEDSKRLAGAEAVVELKSNDEEESEKAEYEAPPAGAETEDAAVPVMELEATGSTDGDTFNAASFCIPIKELG